MSKERREHLGIWASKGADEGWDCPKRLKKSNEKCYQHSYETIFFCLKNTCYHLLSMSEVEKCAVLHTYHFGHSQADVRLKSSRRAGRSSAPYILNSEGVSSAS